MVLYLLLGLTGLGTGIVGSMLGLGGSIVLIPALNELFGVHQHLHQSAGMIVNMFVVLPATWRHARAGMVSWPFVRTCAPAAVLAVLAGVQISELPYFQGAGQVQLAALLGVFLCAAAAHNVYRVYRPPPQPPAGEGPRDGWRGVLLVGVPTGLVAGTLGLGGGLVAVPSQQWWLRTPLRRAIGNSCALVCVLSLVGAISKNLHWAAQHQPELPAGLGPVQLAAILVPAVIAGSFIGSALTHRLPVRAVTLVLAVLLAAAGLRQLSFGLPAL